ncbi:cytochrome D ubiquinol oxidase subunit I [Sulfurifustis variabilis]|uniref:Cytochrome D ubiquinol oxidase subunit I n=1 Tax=Sulfurifustis variabilis TaxID=1675686 RepID=A0A1B4VAP9_9GAMM|nr:cytochrome ubiquinol oxidase subunit I [Sulfurifustis variabilis]BAU48834.1 cytochrome D ubiquinol oxidase subunit I [Sulfurifustis variabilis]
MEWDATLLSRIQFGFTLGFHILFPTLTIGLSGFLVILHGAWLYTAREEYLRLYRFWLKIFALGFGTGVVSGIVLSFEFGMNFARFSQATGNVLGPLLGYEVLMAFFLEASFLPIMLFGWGRVGPRLHFLATVMVALGTFLSAFWILAANSWMHTPAGFELRDGVFYVRDWWSVVFNPSFPYRLAHMLMASLLTAAFVIAGVSAWHLRRGVHAALARRALAVSILSAAVFAPAQILIGDLHGLQVARDQPVKVAAMEALWETTEAAPFVLVGWPDEAREANRFAVEIPYAASLILTHSPTGRVPGLDQAQAADRPHVPTVFFSFRVMLAIGFYFLFVAWTGLVLWWRGRLYDRAWFQRLCIAAIPLGFVAVIAGWLVVEVGRQPWVVHGMLRTADAASALEPSAVAGSLTLFVLAYLVLLGAFLAFAFRLASQGPETAVPPQARRLPRTVWRATP